MNDGLTNAEGCVSEVDWAPVRRICATAFLKEQDEFAVIQTRGAVPGEAIIDSAHEKVRDFGLRLCNLVKINREKGGTRGLAVVKGLDSVRELIIVAVPRDVKRDSSGDARDGSS
jgi:hypothetical protein